MSDSAALWTVAHQAPLSMGFSKQNTGVGCISSSRGSSRPWGFPGGASGKEPAGPCRRQKRHGSILGLGRSPRGGHGIPLQYSCLENPTDRSLVGYSPWGHEELDTTEALSTQGSNPGLLRCGQVVYLQSHQGSPVADLPSNVFFIIFFLLFLFSVWERPDSHNLPCVYCLKVQYLFFSAVVILLFILMTLTIRVFSVVVKWYLLMFQTFCT